MSSQTNEAKIGLLDLPASEDQLGVKSQVTGLAEFVKQCETPMTIAVQGGWGTGKTSVMKMLARDLDSNDSVHVVEFNTWQYAQFDLGEQLATSLLMRIIAELPTSAEGPSGKDRLLKITQTLLSTSATVLTPIVTNVANTVLPGLGDGLKEIPGQIAQRNGGNGVGASAGAGVAAVAAATISPIEAIEQLRGEFARLVRASGKRVLVFVDDLDRLEPKRAVELMEAIKLFLDVENCVFVLAIDFDVVKRGVVEKYGQGFGDRKARAFFEKIIQIPFQLPTHLYNVEPLLQAGLHKMIAPNEAIGEYVALARESIGTNPRAMKRLINTFALLKQMQAPVQGAGGAVQPDIDIFASLCLQNAHPSIAEFLNFRPGFEGVDDVLPSVDEESDAAEDTGDRVPDNPRLEDKNSVRDWREEWARATPFLKHLRAFFSNEEGFQEERFRAATEITQTTSAGETSKQSEEVGARKWNPTAEPNEMRARLDGKTWPGAIDRAMSLRTLLEDDVKMVGNRGADWTLNRTDRTSKRRFASLAFRKRTLRLDLEKFVQGTDEEAAREVREKCRELLTDPVSSTGPAIEPFVWGGRFLGVRVSWSESEPFDIERVAELIRFVLGR